MVKNKEKLNFFLDFNQMEVARIMKKKKKVRSAKPFFEKLLKDPEVRVAYKKEKLKSDAVLEKIETKSFMKAAKKAFKKHKGAMDKLKD
jgi:RNase H-fold protein (predicted Holliday junction resolvase)